MRRASASMLLLAALALAAPAAAQLVEVGKAPRSDRSAKTRELRVLRLGIVAPVRRDAALARVEPFRAHLAGSLDTSVTVQTFDDETALVGALVAGRIDYAPLSALGFAVASRRCDCVEPLAAPRAADRAPGWHAVVLARPGAAPAKVGDLAGLRLAVTEGDAIGTRRLPLMLLARLGLTGDKAPVLVETAGPKEAMGALMEGRADAAVVWSSLDGDPQEGWSRGTPAEMVAAGLVKPSDYRVVWSSPVLPLGPHVVRAALDEATKRRLRELLIQLDTDPELYEAIERENSGGFVRVGTPAYRPFIDLLAPDDAGPDKPTTTGTAPGRG